jgi:hypothetical protein
MIVLALNRVDPAALIEAENFVTQVQPVGEEAKPLVDSIAALNVELRVGAARNRSGNEFPRLSPTKEGFPTETESVGRFIVLTLNEKGIASGVEPEDFVI